MKIRENAKGKLKDAIDELCDCNNHLNTAYSSTDDSRNKTEIHAALKSVASALKSAQCTLNNYKD